ncbi:hypothetical protein RRG08_027751 [Elysia crispata]|uniref:Uncharacterized protein n=1 Tax=Elysia crispata TaxID=231223 RepID=A0AAE0Z9C4_9GAST|nr:hypothetical protein RRG08_027751 [Elysia crispata]
MFFLGTLSEHSRRRSPRSWEQLLLLVLIKTEHESMSGVVGQQGSVEWSHTMTVLNLQQAYYAMAGTARENLAQASRTFSLVLSSTSGLVITKPIGVKEHPAFDL